MNAMSRISWVWRLCINPINPDAHYSKQNDISWKYLEDDKIIKIYGVFDLLNKELIKMFENEMGRLIDRTEKILKGYIDSTNRQITAVDHKYIDYHEIYLDWDIKLTKCSTQEYIPFHSHLKKEIAGMCMKIKRELFPITQ